MKSLLAIIVIAGIGMKIGAMETVLLEGWRFFRGEEHGAQALDCDDSSWESVRIPHDWAIAGPFDRTNDLQVTKTLWEGETIVRTHTGRTGGLPWVGKGWYRRSLDIPKGTEYAELVFDGAMSAPTVYADGKKSENGNTAIVLLSCQFLQQQEKLQCHWKISLQAPAGILVLD